MKTLLLITLLFITSCSGISRFHSDLKFRKLAEDHLFDSYIALRKIDNEIEYVKVIKVETIADIVSSIVLMSVELKEERIVHFIKFSTDENFIVSESTLKDIAKAHNSNIIIYVEAENVLRYELDSSYKEIKIIEKQGNKFFNAFMFSKVNMDNSSIITLP
jgi:hypothetical protein